MAVVKILTSVPGGFKQVPATDQPQVDAGAMTVTPAGTSTSVAVPDAFSGIPVFDILRAGIGTRTMKVPAFSITGFRAKGDRGNGTVYESVANGTIPGAVQDASGAWFAPKRAGTLPLRAGSFGAYGDNSNSDTATLNALAAAGRSVGAALRIEAGIYKMDGTGLFLDYSSQASEATVSPVGVSLTGDGPHNTVFLASEPSTISASPPRYAIEILGSTQPLGGVSSFVHMPFGQFAVGRGPQAQAQSLGMHIKSAQFLHGRNVVFQGLGYGLDLESVLSSSFDGFQFASNLVGLRLRKGTGFSNFNAVTFNKPIFRLNSSAGITSDSAITALSLNSAQIEGNGTMGDLTSGGAYLVFNSDQEGGTGLVMSGGYVEGNKGGYDLFLNNAGTSQVLHVIVGVTFNQSSGTNYAKNRIKLGGPSKLILIGCAFKVYNDYSPNAARPIVDYDPAVSEVICIGCDLGPAVERNGLRNQAELTLRGSVNADGTAASLPAGWTSSRSGTGVYVVTIPYALATNLWSVSPMAVNGSITRVDHVQKSTTSFTIVALQGTSTAADTAFDFIYRL